MRNPHVDIIAHLTARQIGRRAPIELDFDAVCKAAVETGTFLEINASPERLDLKDSHVRRAVELGVVFAVSTDSHWPSTFTHMRYGVMNARRGWCGPSRIVNSLSFDKFKEVMSVPKPERYALMERHA